MQKESSTGGSAAASPGVPAPSPLSGQKHWYPQGLEARGPQAGGQHRRVWWGPADSSWVAPLWSCHQQRLPGAGLAFRGPWSYIGLVNSF